MGQNNRKILILYTVVVVQLRFFSQHNIGRLTDMVDLHIFGAHHTYRNSCIFYQDNHLFVNNQTCSQDRPGHHLSRLSMISSKMVPVKRCSLREKEAITSLRVFPSLMSRRTISCRAFMSSIRCWMISLPPDG